MSEKARLKCTVYVGGLDQAVTMQTLAEAFVPFGEVVDITLPKPDLPNSNELHRGFGYVEFDLPEDAREAIDNMDGSELYGRTIKVAAAKPQKDSNEGLGSKTAIWEQVRGDSHQCYTSIANYLRNYRRATWPNTPSMRKTNWPPRGSRQTGTNVKTPCRDWRSWTWLDPSPNEHHHDATRARELAKRRQGEKQRRRRQ